MPRTGNPPVTPKGMRYGGRKRGTKNKKTVERELIEEREKGARIAAAEMKAADYAGRKLAKEVLDDFMQLFAGMAATYQPMPPDALIPPGRQPDEERFEKYGKLAVQCARDLAPYQSPTFRAIMTAPPPPDPGDGQRKRFTLTIFEGAPAPKMLNAPPQPAKNGRNAA